MSKEDLIEVEGKVVEVLPSTTFKVDIGNGRTIIAHISGKLRMNYIRILQGDIVKVEISPYDLTRGRITWRGKEKPKSADKSIDQDSEGSISDKDGYKEQPDGAHDISKTGSDISDEG